MIKDRIIQILEYKGIAKEEFYKKIGMTSASFRGSAKKTPLNSNAIENILSIIPDLSPDWLISGKEPMLRPVNTDSLTAQPQQRDIVDFLKEQIQEKDKKIELQAQDIGQLKQQITDLRDGRLRSSAAEAAGVAGVG